MQNMQSLHCMSAVCTVYAATAGQTQAQTDATQQILAKSKRDTKPYCLVSLLRLAKIFSCIFSVRCCLSSRRGFGCVWLCMVSKSWPCQLLNHLEALSYTVVTMLFRSLTDSFLLYQSTAVLTHSRLVVRVDVFHLQIQDLLSGSRTALIELSHSNFSDAVCLPSVPYCHMVPHGHKCKKQQQQQQQQPPGRLVSCPVDWGEKQSLPHFASQIWIPNP